jgi:glucosamine--fructose-6-phosphate aminotransferase (isomerizing)
MFREAAQAPDVVARQLARNAAVVQALGRRLRERTPRAVVTIARGSSDHAATYAKYLVETRLGILTSSSSPSTASVYGAQPQLEDCLVLAMSQSGRSPDLLAAAEAAKRAGGTVVAIVNDEASPLAALAQHCLPLAAGPEESVAATKTHLATVSAVVHLVSAWTEDTALGTALAHAPEDLARAWQLDWDAALSPLVGAGHLFVLGRGVGLGAAQEAALKCKETCGLHAEAFSAAEVRHGPQALLDERFPALVFAQEDETRAGLEAYVRELLARGVPVMAAGLSAPGAVMLPAVEGAHPAIAPMLLTEAFYRLANALAIARGYDPDAPPHLRKVTETH